MARKPSTDASSEQMGSGPASSEPAQAAAGTIDRDTAARLAKCTPRWINKLVQDGYIPKPARGRYTVLGVVHGRIDSLQDEQRRASKSAADSRVRDARAAEIEQRVAERSGRLIDYDDAIGSFDEALGIIRAELSGLPARVTRDLSLRRKFETEIDEILTRAADRLEQAAGDPAPGGDDDPPVAANGAGRVGTH